VLLLLLLLYSILFAQALKAFRVDQAVFSKLDASVKKWSVADAMIDRATKVVHSCRIFKFEAMLVLIFYHSQTTKPGKAVVRAESEFAETALVPADVIFGPLWTQAMSAKADEASQPAKAKKAKKAKA
jgi:hypothetical protein